MHCHGKMSDLLLSEQSSKQYSHSPWLTSQLLPPHQASLEADSIVVLKVMHRVGSGVTHRRFGRTREVLCTRASKP